MPPPAAPGAEVGGGGTARGHRGWCAGRRRSAIVFTGWNENTAMRPNTELLLYCASRAQLVGEVIRPYLAQGGVVICDRYADSTLAYQGYGHGLDIKTLKVILDFATEGLKPDLTLYLDITPETGLRRRQNGSLFGEEWNRMDDMTLAFYRRAYDGYRKLMRADRARWVRIDADQPVEQVQADVQAALAMRLRQEA